MSPEDNYGWICPVCNSCHSPYVDSCDHTEEVDPKEEAERFFSNDLRQLELFTSRN